MKNFAQIVLEHIGRYPEMQIRDLYKLAYQAVFGNAHLGMDRKKARDALLSELNVVKPGFALPLIEIIGADTLMLRINLGAFKALNGNPESLLSALVGTANHHRGSISEFKNYLNFILVQAEQGALPFNKSEMRRWFNEMEQRRFPQAHHSQVYRSLYNPAYRVVRADFLKKLI